MNINNPLWFSFNDVTFKYFFNKERYVSLKKQKKTSSFTLIFFACIRDIYNTIIICLYLYGYFDAQGYIYVGVETVTVVEKIYWDDSAKNFTDVSTFVLCHFLD